MKLPFFVAMSARRGAEVQAGKAFLVGLEAFLRVNAMGPFSSEYITHAALTRTIYVSPSTDARTAQDEPEAFAAKMGSALGCGKSFHLKRAAFEMYNFYLDLMHLKNQSRCTGEFALLFRPFWDKDDQKPLEGADLWAQTKRLRDIGVTSSARCCRCFSYSTFQRT
jgi:hypothetical protein